VITIRGLSNQYLEIDVGQRTWNVFTIDRQTCMEYLGGKGVGLKLLYDRFSKLEHAEPLGKDNMLCFSMGAFLGTGATCSACFEATAKSPLTGILAGSSCKGPFGEACKTAGWDGFLITGVSPVPVILRIDEEGVSFQEAKELWGLDTEETRRKLDLTPRDGEAVIGPAGENLVRYANIRSGKQNFGRGGLGAVMGSKRIKAIVARGKSHSISPVLPELFERTHRRSLAFTKRNSFSKAYRAYGTNADTAYAKSAGFAAVYNFQDRLHPDLDAITGEAMEQRYRSFHSGCRYCTILCGHAGIFPDGRKRQLPEYETVGMFGSNIGNFNTDAIVSWNEQMDRYGMDAVSAGGSIAWAMEAKQRGIRDSVLEFGKFDAVSAVLKDIAYMRDEGAELAKGTRWLSTVYGGTSFACHVKGLEMAAYDPRAAWGHGLAYAVANRGGCHLSSYMIGPEAIFGFLDPYSTRSKANWTVFFENLFAAADSLQTCLFSVFPVILEPAAVRLTPKKVLSLMMTRAPNLAQKVMDWSILSDYYRSITGYPVSQKVLLEAGERMLVLERYMNTRMGIDSNMDTLPKRFTEEGETMHKRKSVVPIQEMVKQYYQLRGYDQQGIPAEETLRRLGIVGE